LKDLFFSKWKMALASPQKRCTWDAGFGSRVHMHLLFQMQFKHILN
jgi:hypothetical protein